MDDFDGRLFGKGAFRVACAQAASPRAEDLALLYDEHDQSEQANCARGAIEVSKHAARKLGLTSPLEERATPSNQTFLNAPRVTGGHHQKAVLD